MTTSKWTPEDSDRTLILRRNPKIGNGKIKPLEREKMKRAATKEEWMCIARDDQGNK